MRRWNTWHLKKRRKNAPKKRAIVDEAFLDTLRGSGRCWHCGNPSSCLEAAHLFGRGQESWCRFDIPENVASLCRACHQSSHSGLEPTTLTLLHLVAARIGSTADAIRDRIATLKYGALP